jgi:hypothetical protein
VGKVHAPQVQASEQVRVPGNVVLHAAIEQASLVPFGHSMPRLAFWSIVPSQSLSMPSHVSCLGAQAIVQFESHDGVPGVLQVPFEYVQLAGVDPATHCMPGPLSFVPSQSSSSPLQISTPAWQVPHLQTPFTLLQSRVPCESAQPAPDAQELV